MATPPPIPNLDRIETYAPVSSAGPFPISFPLYDATGADLLVELDGAAQVANWTLTVTASTDAPNTWVNGSITFTAPISGHLVIEGDRAPRRIGQYQECRGIPAADQNTEWNILTALARELKQRVKRAIMVPRGEGSLVIPSAADRAAKFLGFDTDGKATALSAQPYAPDMASQAEAEAGISNLRAMSPLRTRQAFAILTDRFNAVTEGGVDNSGGTAVGASLAAALAAATAAGKTLWLPKGRYKLGATETLDPPAGARIECSGGAVLAREDNVILPLIWVKQNGVKLERLSFEYTPVVHTVSGTHCAVYAEGVQDFIANELKAAGKFYVAFNETETLRSAWRDCFSKGFINRGFYINAGRGGTTSGVIRSARYENCHADGDGVGFYGFNTNAFGTAFGEDLVFIGCSARGVTQHSFAATERMADVKFIGCHSESLNVGFVAQKANGFRNQQAVFKGCSAKGGANPFYITDADYAVLDGCVATAASGSGFLCIDSSYVKHIGCKSIGNGAAGFISTATTLGSGQRTDYVGCEATLNTGYGFSTDANVTYAKTVGCDAVGNTAGQYSLANATCVGVASL